MKPWYLSRTLWVAILTGIAGILNALLEIVENATALSLIGTVVAIIFAVLRTMTSEPIGKDVSVGPQG